MNHKKVEMPIIFKILFVVIIFLSVSALIEIDAKGSKCENSCMAESDHFLVDYETSIKGYFGLGETICKCFYANKVISFELKE